MIAPTPRLTEADVRAQVLYEYRARRRACGETPAEAMAGIRDRAANSYMYGVKFCMNKTSPAQREIFLTWKAAADYWRALTAAEMSQRLRTGATGSTYVGALLSRGVTVR